MKPFVQKLPLSENTSFVARTYRTPEFETNWHQHPEFELILFTQGMGLAFVGNYVGEFEVDDIFLIGSNLPHTFQKQTKDLVASCVVVQFLGNFWGDGFLELPESQPVKQLLINSSKGLKIKSTANNNLKMLIKDLEHTNGLKRILKLCECLLEIKKETAVSTLSTHDIQHKNSKDKDRIDKIIQYTIDSFQENIVLADVANIINMSVSAFCRYFKKSTKKTYINFLNEIRVGHACKRLVDTKMSVINICYESGFGTLANFNKQFLHLKKTTPSRYRKQFEDKKFS